MYTKDKSHRITLRLNENQFDFVRMNAEQLDVSPSDFLRMVINSSMFAWKQMSDSDKYKEAMGEIVVSASSKVTEGIGRENDEANQHNFI